MILCGLSNHPMYPKRKIIEANIANNYTINENESHAQVVLLLFGKE